MKTSNFEFLILLLSNVIHRFEKRQTECRSLRLFFLSEMESWYIGNHRAEEVYSACVPSLTVGVGSCWSLHILLATLLTQNTLMTSPLLLPSHTVKSSMFPCGLKGGGKEGGNEATEDGRQLVPLIRCVLIEEHVSDYPQHQQPTYSRLQNHTKLFSTDIYTDSPYMS